MSTPVDSPLDTDGGAVLIDGDSRVYVLIGKIVRMIDEDATSYHLLVDIKGNTRPIDAEYLPLFRFFEIPRTEALARQFLGASGVPAGFLKIILKLGYVVSIDTRTPAAAARSLRWLKLSARCTAGDTQEDGRIEVLNKDAETTAVYVNPMLGETLWENEGDLDIPNMIRKLSLSTKQRLDVVAREVLTLVPALLRDGHVRLEWLHAPRA